MINGTIVTEFFLMGFSDIRELQILHFVLFLTVYLAALMGNFLIILIVAQSQHLHTPMYFFLVNLSFADICYISTTVPKSMAVSLTINNLISFSGCVSQVFLIMLCAGLELTLLLVMAYDRYVAVCHPLQYGQIMSLNACLQMAAASWICSIINAVFQTTKTFRLHFCQSNVVHQFFCDIPQLLDISCTDTEKYEMFLLAAIFTIDIFSLMFMFASYGYIFVIVFRIQSAQGRHKAFSTCIPHLTVFFLLIFTSAFCYLRPKAWSTPIVDLLSAILYTVVPPLMNPIIYSLRNKDIQGALRSMSMKQLGFHTVILSASALHV